MGNNISNWAWNRTCGEALVWYRKNRITNAVVDISTTRSIERQVVGVKVLVVALSYQEVYGPKDRKIAPLRSRLDVEKIFSLFQRAGVRDITMLTDEEGMAPTKANLTQTLRELGAKTHPDECFVFYFIGHGRRIAKAPGEDLEEALCLISENRRLNRKTMLFSDELLSSIDEFFHADCRVTLLLDCCHSAGITQLTGENFLNPTRELVAISACQGVEVAYEFGFGGVFTQALIRAVHKLDDLREKLAQKQNSSILETPSYTIAHVFNGMIRWMYTKGYSDGRVGTQFTQELSIIWSPAASPDSFPWVLSQHGFVCVIDEGNNYETETAPHLVSVN